MQAMNIISSCGSRKKERPVYVVTSQTCHGKNILGDFSLELVVIKEMSTVKCMQYHDLQVSCVQ